MQDYKHILIATDSASKSDAIVRRAARIAELCDARVTLIQVLEHLPADIPVDPVPPEGVDKIEWLKERAREGLSTMAGKHGLHNPQVAVEVGSPKNEIIRRAQDGGVDLIVVGAHERHGIALLRGSTTDGVVHKAPCDVLTVHIAP